MASTPELNSPMDAAGQLAAPIGVFDSGVGGLTVLRSLMQRLPAEDFVYLGDTARLPYGTRSADTVRAYARQAARLLIERGVKLLVIACNTASAVAIEDLTAAFDPLPVIGVVEAGASAAAAQSVGGRVLVTGTEGTIRGGAYPRALVRLRADLKIEAQACPLFVALAEEGWGHGPIAEAVVARYLGPWFGAAASPTAQVSPDLVLLGCTHFPALRDAIAKFVGPEVKLVDSADPTAAAVDALLHERGLARALVDGGRPTQIELLATDAPERFARVAPHFLGGALDVRSVKLVDL